MSLKDEIKKTKKRIDGSVLYIIDLINELDGHKCYLVREREKLAALKAKRNKTKTPSKPAPKQS